MPDLTTYFDKKPTRSYTLGPSGRGIPQTQFSDTWQVWYEEGVGITYVLDSLYNQNSPTGYHISGSQDILSAEAMSATFDSGAYLWAAVNNFDTIDVFQFSGSSYLTRTTFSGSSPVIFYNLSNLSSGIASGRFVNCFYLKNNQNKIFSRSSQDNFSGEYVLHQDFQGQVEKLNQVTYSHPEVGKIEIYGLYSDGNGFRLISNKFPPINETFRNFENESLGYVSLLLGMGVESLNPSGYFLQYTNEIGDGFETTPTGNINYLTSGNNMLIGYFLNG